MATASPIQVTVTLGSPGWTATATVCVTRQIQVAVDSGFPRPYETYPPPEDPIDEVWAGMVLLSGNATTTELIALGLTVLGSEFSAGPTKTWVRCGHAGILAMRENENMLRFPNRFFKVAVSEGTPSLSRIKQLWPHDYRRVVGAEILT
jgi:hypothetical protein